MNIREYFRIIIGVFLLAILLLGAVACGLREDVAEAMGSEPELAEPSPVSAEVLSPDHDDGPSYDDALSDEDSLPEPEPEYDHITALPVWMYIPAIGVDAEIRGTETDHEMDTMVILPSGSIISWWLESPIPGNRGNAIFGSHNRWGGRDGQLLWLDTLDIGDEMVIVYDDGTSMEFRLESVFVYWLETAPARTIMSVWGETRVTVITCKDPYNPLTGTSDYRIIAIFKPAEGFVIPDPPIEPFPPQTEILLSKDSSEP